MSRTEALSLIKSALSTVCPDFKGEITEDTDLVNENIIDSLDSMTLLFEIEDKLGKKLTSIGEDYDDFSVGALIDVITAA